MTFENCINIIIPNCVYQCETLNLQWTLLVFIFLGMNVGIRVSQPTLFTLYYSFVKIRKPKCTCFKSMKWFNVEIKCMPSGSPEQGITQITGMETSKICLISLDIEFKNDPHFLVV